MNIIIIEHSNFSTRQIQETFKAKGYDVFSFSSLVEVKNFVDSKCPSLFLLPVDKLGFSISKFVRSSKVIDYNLSSTPIMFLGEKNNISQRVDSISNGGTDFVDKLDIVKIFEYSLNLLEPDLIWKGRKIVIVEDDSVSAKRISSYIENMGSDVSWFSRAIDCFEYLKKEKVDILIVDYHMPGLKDGELARKVRNELGLKDLPIIFISSNLDKDVILDFYQSGGNDYISKPFLKEELYTKVKLQMENSQSTKSLNVYIDELKHLSRLKDQFLAVCSHDIKTPLSSIIGYSDILKKDSLVHEEAAEIVEIISRASKDILSLVDDLLVCSEIHLSREVELEEVEVLRIVEYVLKQIKGISKKDLNYKVFLDVKKPIILGNKAMLRRLFSNLYSNALKFTPEGGIIETRIWEDEGHVMCSIRDSGIGIPSDSITRIFSRMSGVGRVGLEGQKSNGLGLSIVKDIMEKHNGRVEVHSKENIGTIFTLTFKNGR